jgi:hypothetical protein
MIAAGAFNFGDAQHAAAQHAAASEASNA